MKFKNVEIQYVVPKVLLVWLLMLSACASTGNNSNTAGNSNSPAPARALTASEPLPRPKLVIGIVVDQMRYDFLYRYWSKYGNGGFKRLVADGYNFKNAQYNYVPTYTGPGHASIYTGTTPAVNGIVGNNWYSREKGDVIYCTEDKTVKTVGSNNKAAGEMSPANMLTTTVTDELRLATNKGSKVIGVALKDRGAILPAGHMANGAYWYDGTSGNFITSTFYMQQLPDWVNRFNSQKYPEKHLSKVWDTLLPQGEEDGQYTESTADDTPYENKFANEKAPVFPHDLPNIKGDDFELLRNTPGGNTITFDFAKAAIEGEGLGKGAHTDFLAMSFSTPDYVGHTFGPNSMEVQDLYLRMDQELEEFLNYIDQNIGKENVLIFLTADHGAAHVPGFMRDNRIPAGVLDAKELTASLEEYLKKEYGEGKWILSTINMQVYLNHQLIREKKVNKQEMEEKIAAFVLEIKGVANAFPATSIYRSNWTTGLKGNVEKGFNVKRSGDVVILFEPAWFEGYGGFDRKGTTHGSYGKHDTHIPMIYYGWKVQPGESSVEAHVEDIAPTIASWLYIMEPNGSTGKPLQPYMK